MPDALGLGFVRPRSSALPAEVLSWNKQNFGRGLTVMPNSEVAYSREGVHSHDVGAIQTRDKIPRIRGIYYFEVEIIDPGERGTISLGFADGNFKLNRHCGWEVNSYGYHGDDGKKYCGSGTGTSYGPTFHAGDIIGVGLNTESNSIFFTRNGSWLGVAFKNVCSDALYPTVGLHSRGERVSANFGTNPFTFDIKARESEENIFTISDVSTEQLHTSMTHQLVKDYLRHHGHANTLKALDKNPKRSGKSSELSDELLNLNERSLVNSLIVQGKAGAARKRIFEHVQTDESHPTPDELGLVALYLSCQECVELVRRGEISTAVDYATTAIRTGVRRDHTYNGFIRDRIALLGYEIPGQSRVGSLLNLCERDDVARAVSTTLLTPEYHLTHVSRNLRARIRKTHMTADINIPWGLSHQRVPPSPKLKGGEIDAESKRPCQDHKVPVIRASADTAVHGFGSRAEFFIQQKLVAQSF